MQHTNLGNKKIYFTKNRDKLIEYAVTSKKILIALNAEKILNKNLKLTQIINNNIGCADGVGAVYAVKQKGYKDVIKIAGCELWIDIVKKYHSKKSFYFLGSKKNVIERVVKKLKKSFNNINIVGYRDGYFFGKQQEKNIINEIVNLKPDFIFVAMGSPKQEFFMSKIQNKHNSLMIGLGGSFDIFVGNLERAPSWWIKNNLEWAYRLFKEPSRISRQIKLIKLLFLIIFKKL